MQRAGSWYPNQPRGWVIDRWSVVRTPAWEDGPTCTNWPPPVTQHAPVRWAPAEAAPPHERRRQRCLECIMVVVDGAGTLKSGVAS